MKNYFKVIAANLFIFLIITSQTDLKGQLQLSVGNIKWQGNSKYSDEELTDRFQLKKGDLFSQKKLNEALRWHPENTQNDISSLYMDNGYLFFSITPEQTEENGKVNITLQVYEGPQVIVKNILFKGNQKLSDQELMVYVDLKSGDLFNRSRLLSSQQKLVNSGFFAPDKVIPRPIPNETKSEVDVVFDLEEL